MLGHVSQCRMRVMKTNKLPTTDMPQQNNSLFLALELSKSQWTLCFGDGQHMRRRTISGGDCAALLREIQSSSQKFGLAADAPVYSCYEAGRDGFWLHRFLLKHQVQNRVFDSASIEVNRRQKHKKTDRVDAEKLLRLLLRIVLFGETRVCAIVRVPSVEQEAALRVGRERERLVKERTAHRARIRSLLQLHGIQIKSLARLNVQVLVDRQGQPLPRAWGIELEREQQRLNLVNDQVRQLEAQQHQQIKQSATPATCKAAKLMRLRAVGPQSGWLLSHEFFWRDFNNRREVGACAGLAGSPYDSGQSQREQGISKAGNRRVRTLCIELAWSWVRYQPQSQLTQWFWQRFGKGTARQRRVGIVALARKLLVALWKYLDQDLMPEAAQLKATL